MQASMRVQTILFLLVDRVKGKLDCRPYRGGGESNPKRLVEAASRAFSNRSNILTIRAGLSRDISDDNLHTASGVADCGCHRYASSSVAIPTSSICFGPQSP